MACHCIRSEGETILCGECSVKESMRALREEGRQEVLRALRKSKSLCTLGEAVSLLGIDLVKFEAEWRKNHVKDPKNWPLELGISDWFAQFEEFVHGDPQG